MTESPDSMADSDLTSDADLVRAALAGDSRAFERLVLRHRERLFGLAMHLSGDADLSADLTQEALVAAYTTLDRLRDPSIFGGWVSGILRNKWRNFGRSRVSAPLSLDQLIEAGYEPPQVDAESQADGAVDPAELMACAESLPEKYRAPLLLRYCGDQSYKEIAETLGLKETTVTMRLTYARRLLLKKAKARGLI